MGTKERKQREKEALREKIVQEASTLFLEKGFEQTKIRTIAERIEYSPATIYLYFKDKNELFYAIMERAFALFFQALSPSYALRDPMARLRSLNRAYVDFALSQPHYYELMFLLKGPMTHLPLEERWETGRKTHENLTQTVQACIDQGYFPDQDPAALSLLLWSSLHGLVSLHLRNRLNLYPEESRHSLLDQALEALEKMWNFPV